jgi:chloramphenicol-sensitive protein RarD
MWPTPGKTARCFAADPFAGGLLANVTARILWGAAAYYIGISRANDAGRVFGQRLMWAFAVVLLVSALRGEMPALTAALRDGKTMAVTGVAAVVISSNWFLVIWCVKNGELTAAGLGFFIAPILTVLGGVAVLGERSSAGIVLSLALCAAGVGLYYLNDILIAWQALFVAATSAIYALLRRRHPLPALTASTLETAIALALSAILLVSISGAGALLPPSEDGVVYYLGLGVVTTAPMLLYISSLSRIPVSLAGYLQYVTPTVMMGVAILAFGETVQRHQVFGLLIIWMAIAIFLISSKWRHRTTTAPSAGGGE